MKIHKPLWAFQPLFLLLPLVSCGGAAKEGVSVTLTGDDPVLSFAKEEILSSAKAVGLEERGGDYQISFGGIDTQLGEQVYTLSVEGKNITIKGGDTRGLLYGGLEVADYLKENHGLSGIKDKKVSPYIQERMLKLNAPLDMRTPSYTDTGENAQAQIKDMWDLSFWKEYFDAAARNRFNAVNLWSLNPFPSLVKVPGYEDVALADVWKTKIPFDATYSGNCANAVREEHWTEGSYEIVKTLSIDEKIAHFNSVIDLAHNRGIRFYISVWNLYPFGEHGKHGIDAKLDNPVTKDYFTRSTEALLSTYPKLDGMGICTGENLPMADIDLGDLSAAEYKEQWLHDVYAEPIKASLKANPREFKVIHRMHFTDYSVVASIWGDLPCTMDISAKYSSDHMFVNGVHHFADEVLEALPSGQKTLLELRNNDFFNLRFGDYDFVHNYLANMSLEKVSGIVMGSDGYVDGREYFYADEAFNGTLSLEKHFAFYQLFGHMAYDKDFSKERFKGLFFYRFSSVSKENVDALFSAMQVASKVIPTISSLYFVDGDANWYAEACSSHPNTFGYLGIKRWVDSKSSHPYANCLSISEYCKAIKEGSEIDKSKDNPVTISTVLLNLAKEAKEKLALISLSPATKAEKEFLSLAGDQKCFALLGEFYGHKVKSVIALREYNDLGKEEAKVAALAEMNLSVDAYASYAAAFHANYKKMWLTWTGENDMNAYLDKAKEDIDAIASWKKRNY
ncbi:MAG: hypothetical protein J6A47_00995 [Bacilli bacterium]|nr:hypothetical protein [Bacilli bacterium]